MRIRDWELAVGGWELLRTLLVAALVLAMVACGKKGPPLLPFVRIPAAAEVTEARRVGDGVYVTVSVPTADVDGATPASVATIEIYAVTADAAPSPGLGFPLVAETLARHGGASPRYRNFCPR